MSLMCACVQCSRTCASMPFYYNRDKLKFVSLIFFSLFSVAWFNRARIYNNEILASIIDTKPEHIPLLTLSNHHSCFDDPGIWGKCLNDSFINAYIQLWSLISSMT